MFMYEGGGATRIAATRPEGGGDKCSDVATGYKPATLTRGVAKATPRGM